MCIVHAFDTARLICTAHGDDVEGFFYAFIYNVPKNIILLASPSTQHIKQLIPGLMSHSVGALPQSLLSVHCCMPWLTPKMAVRTMAYRMLRKRNLGVAGFDQKLQEA